MSGSIKTLIKRSFNAVGLDVSKRDRLLELIPCDYLQSPFLPRLYRQSVSRLFYVREMLEWVRGIDGDIVECGVSIGHGILGFMLLSELMDRERHVYGFDSFAGFPEPSVQDTKADGSFHVDKGEYATPLEMVTKVLVDARVSEALIERNLHLVRGFFEDSLPSYDGSIALLHLDCDLYDSYKTCLAGLYDKVAPGGLILFDEYGDRNFPGAKQAVDEFFAGKSETVSEYCQLQYQKFYVVKH